MDGYRAKELLSGLLELHHSPIPLFINAPFLLMYHSLGLSAFLLHHASILSTVKSHCLSRCRFFFSPSFPHSIYPVRYELLQANLRCQTHSCQQMSLHTYQLSLLPLCLSICQCAGCKHISCPAVASWPNRGRHHYMEILPAQINVYSILQR